MMGPEAAKTPCTATQWLNFVLIFFRENGKHMNRNIH